jgi:hypothetical protein
VALPLQCLERRGHTRAATRLQRMCWQWEAIQYTCAPFTIFTMAYLVAARVGVAPARRQTCARSDWRARPPPRTAPGDARSPPAGSGPVSVPARYTSQSD